MRLTDKLINDIQCIRCKKIGHNPRKGKRQFFLLGPVGTAAGSEAICRDCRYKFVPRP